MRTHAITRNLMFVGVFVLTLGTASANCPSGKYAALPTGWQFSMGQLPMSLTHLDSTYWYSDGKISCSYNSYSIALKSTSTFPLPIGRGNWQYKEGQVVCNANGDVNACPF